MNKYRECSQKTTYLRIILLAAIASVIVGEGRLHAVQTVVSSANSAEELFTLMMDAEYGVYEEAEQAALEIRLQAYKYYMDQNLDVALEDNTPHMEIFHHIAELYGRLLKLRVKTIIETKQRWPDEPVKAQIDMLAYQPKLLNDMMRNLEWMITLDALELNWEQQKSILANWHRRDMLFMKNHHQVDLRLIDIKATLSAEIPDPGWIDESVDAVVALYDEIINEYKLNYNKTWDLLSPEQRANLRELTFAAFRSQ